MKHLTWTSAALLAVSLAACGDRDAPGAPEQARQSETPQAAADWEASITALRGLADEDFTVADSVEADFEAINAALPELVSVSWDDKSFDADSGATVFSGLRVTIATEPEFGMLAEEAEVWGLNSDFVAARLSGERLAESGLAFSRLEARNVSYFGIAGAMEMLFDTLFEQIEDETGETLDFEIGEFESMTAEMVVSNLSLRPYEFAAVPDTFFADVGIDKGDMSEDDQANAAMALEAVRLAQHVVAVVRTLEVDASAWYDTDVTMQMTQSPGMTTSADVSWDFYGYEDVSGFDLGRAVIVDARQAQSVEVNDTEGELAEAGFENGFGYDQIETTAFMSYENIQLDKLAGFLAMGEFPMMGERDLMSLGTWSARDYKLSLNDGEVFEVGQLDVDAEDFAWLFPTDLSVSLEDAGIGAEALGTFVIDFMPADTTDEESAAFMANFRQAVSKLDEHGLADIPFDVTGHWTWDADTGETAMTSTSQADGFGEGDFAIEINLPDYAGVQSALEGEDVRGDIERLFDERFAFRRFRFFERDTGGYDKLFGYASDVGKLYPDTGWGATIGNMDAAQMRNFIATMIRSGKSAAAQQMPPAAQWLEAAAAYYQTPGGSFEIRIEPSEPLTSQSMDAFGSTATPEQIVEDLGISVTHTPE